MSKHKHMETTYLYTTPCGNCVSVHHVDTAYLYTMWKLHICTQHHGMTLTHTCRSSPRSMTSWLSTCGVMVRPKRLETWLRTPSTRLRCVVLPHTVCCLVFVFVRLCVDIYMYVCGRVLVVSCSGARLMQAVLAPPSHRLMWWTSSRSWGTRAASSWLMTGARRLRGQWPARCAVGVATCAWGALWNRARSQTLGLGSLTDPVQCSMVICSVAW